MSIIELHEFLLALRDSIFLIEAKEGFLAVIAMAEERAKQMMQRAKTDLIMYLRKVFLFIF